MHLSHLPNILPTPPTMRKDVHLSPRSLQICYTAKGTLLVDERLLANQLTLNKEIIGWKSEKERQKSQ